MGGPVVTRRWRRAVLVFVGCLAAATLASFANFPQVAGALLFPSSAVLTVAMLVDTPRHYGLLVLASVAGNFAPHLATGPGAFVLLTEIANVTRALIVVVAVRRFA